VLTINVLHDLAFLCFKPTNHPSSSLYTNVQRFMFLAQNLVATSTKEKANVHLEQIVFIYMPILMVRSKTEAKSRKKE